MSSAATSGRQVWNLHYLLSSSERGMQGAIKELNAETVTGYRLMKLPLTSPEIRKDAFITLESGLRGQQFRGLAGSLDVSRPPQLDYSQGGVLVQFETAWGNTRLPDINPITGDPLGYPGYRSSIPTTSGLSGALPPFRPANELQLNQPVHIPVQPTLPYIRGWVPPYFKDPKAAF